MKANEGGKVDATDDVTSVTVPPFALPKDLAIKVEALGLEELFAPLPADTQLTGAARFQPHGLRFKDPAKVTIALNQLLPPHTMLHLFYYDEIQHSYVDLGPRASVNPGGTSASADVEHFSIYAVGQNAGFACKYDHSEYFPDEDSAWSYANNVTGNSGPDFYYTAEVVGPLDPNLYGVNNWAVNITLCKRESSKGATKQEADPESPKPTPDPDDQEPTAGPDEDETGGDEPTNESDQAGGGQPDNGPSDESSPEGDDRPDDDQATSGPQPPRPDCRWVFSKQFNTTMEANKFAQTIRSAATSGGEYVVTFRVATLPPKGGEIRSVVFVDVWFCPKAEAAALPPGEDQPPKGDNGRQSDDDQPGGNLPDEEQPAEGENEDQGDPTGDDQPVAGDEPAGNGEPPGEGNDEGEGDQAGDDQPADDDDSGGEKADDELEEDQPANGQPPHRPDCRLLFSEQFSTTREANEFAQKIESAVTSEGKFVATYRVVTWPREGEVVSVIFVDVWLCP